MRLDRKMMIRAAVLAGIGLGAGAAQAQKFCRHIGNWVLVDGRYVCAGHYPSGQCVWTDDCRVSAG
ncbi:hypothetical protein [Longimicrobium sp.]|uniref:hypothetical protein n=1 Tax=Longimicrobium sp. TaxID=2029185 RepID=UPI002E36BDB8|nr:hypothetical protein [Longimicrobium sp.]HEX6040487.1 hypothetical protein [Longimicrobium sp.]